MATSRTPIISGNWKMNLNHFEAIQTVQKLHYSIPKDTYDGVDVSVHPPFTDIRSVQTVIEADDLQILLVAPDGSTSSFILRSRNEAASRIAASGTRITSASCAIRIVKARAPIPVRRPSATVTGDSTPGWRIPDVSDRYASSTANGSAPTYTTFGSHSETATAPIEPPK